MLDDEAIAALINPGVNDGVYFGRTILPEMHTLPPGHIHKEMWRIAISQDYERVAFCVFRDAGKTTTVRAICLHRICYAISQTIAIVSLSATHSAMSLAAIRHEIETNEILQTIFRLRIGSPANETQLTVHNDLFGTTTVILAQGITGQTRGTNVRGRRPDFIIADDVMDIETTATPEQRKKLADLYFNDVQNTLAARTVNPHAKIMLIGTAMHEEDLFAMCRKNPTYEVFTHSIFLPDGTSAWPAKWSTPKLLAEKAAAIAMGDIAEAGWMREKECVIIRNTFRTFGRLSLLSVPPPDTLPKKGLIYVGSVDPAPPPTEKQIQKGMLKKDAEVWTVTCANLNTRTIDVVEQISMTGQVPEESLAAFWTLHDKYNLYCLGVEVIQYQVALAYALRKSMQDKRKYVRIIELSDHRNKIVRISQTVALYAQHQKLRAAITCGKLREQFMKHPDVDHDDELDSLSLNLLTWEQLGIYSDILSLEQTTAGMSDGDVMRRLLDEERGVPPLYVTQVP